MRRPRTLRLVSNRGGIIEGGPGTAPGTAIYTGTPTVTTAAPTPPAAITVTPPAIAAAPSTDYTYVDPPQPQLTQNFPIPDGFDPWIYLASNPDVARYALSVLGNDWNKVASYGTASYKEHGGAWNSFDAIAYAAANPTIAAYYGTDRRTLAIRYVQGGAVDPLTPPASTQPAAVTPAANVGTPYAAALAGVTPDSLASLSYQLAHLDLSKIPVIVGGISFGGPGPFSAPLGAGGGVITGVDVGDQPGGFGGAFGTGFSSGYGGQTNYGQAGKSGTAGGGGYSGTAYYTGTAAQPVQFETQATQTEQPEVVTVTGTGTDYDLQPVPVTPTEFSNQVPYTVPDFPIYAGTLTPPPVTPSSYVLTPGVPAVPPETEPEVVEVTAAPYQQPTLTPPPVTPSSYVLTPGIPAVPPFVDDTEVVTVTGTPYPPRDLTPPPVTPSSYVLTPGIPAVPPFEDDTEVVVVTAAPYPPRELTPPPVTASDYTNILTPGVPPLVVAGGTPPSSGTIYVGGTPAIVNVGTLGYGTGYFPTATGGGSIDTGTGGTPSPVTTQTPPRSSGAGFNPWWILLLLAAAATEAHTRGAR